jgi:hypothetical protein
MPNLEIRVQVKVAGKAIKNFPIVRRLEGVSTVSGEVLNHVTASLSTNFFTNALSVLCLQPLDCTLALVQTADTDATRIKVNAKGLVAFFNASITSQSITTTPTGDVRCVTAGTSRL